jgi:hypothetical protein
MTLFRSLSVSVLWRPAHAIVTTLLRCVFAGSGYAVERVRQGNVSLPNSGAPKVREAFLCGRARGYESSMALEGRPGFERGLQYVMHFLIIFWVTLLPASVLAQTQASQAASPTPQFPKVTTTPAGRLVTYTPQVEEWPDYDRVVGWVAVEVTLEGTDKPSLGTIRFEGKTVSDLDQRTVTFYELELTQVRFPRATDEQSVALEDFVRNTISQTRQTVPLDVVLHYLADDVIPTGSTGFSMAPPKIFFSTSDGRLLILDGPPILVPVENTNLKFAANTNWDLFYDEADTTWYLLDGKRWLAMGSEDLDGNWIGTDELPAGFNKLPDNGNWEDARAAIPARADDSAPPEIFISEVPAELILTEGDPQLEAITDTGISYVTNSEAELFLYDDTYYYLVSGRWFMAEALSGTWSAVEALPENFANIPPDHPRGDVRVAVAGTDEAKLAVLEADIPRKAEIKRGYVPDVTVEYAGDQPQFEQVPGTEVYRAVNSQFDVLQTGGEYYLCYNAVWYVSSEPAGPWTVADQIPAELYSIPPSSPAHHVTHVHVYDSDDDSVTTGYDSGYANVYMSYGVTMYGTGWYYPPYYYYGRYPYYYWYPRTYGAGAWYNPTTGNYGRAQVAYGPYGGAGRAAVYNPETGAYARGRAVWDSDEIARQAIGYNPRTGTGVYTNRYATEDSGWGESLVTRNDEWIHTQTERQGNTSTTDFETSRGTTGKLEREYNDGQLTGSGEISRGDQSIDSEMIRTEDGVARKFSGEDGSTGGYVRNTEGDLYAGKDGDVYKREDGEWYKYGGDDWESIDRESGGDRNFDLTSEDIQASRGQTGERRETQADRDPGGAQEAQTYRDLSGGTRVTGMSTRDSQADLRTNQLNRDYAARHNGYDRYNNISSRRAAGGAYRGGGRRR